MIGRVTIVTIKLPGQLPILFFVKLIDKLKNVILNYLKFFKKLYLHLLKLGLYLLKLSKIDWPRNYSYH